MKLGEVYVHLYYYALNNIFLNLYNIIMNAWRNNVRVTLWLYYIAVQ